jgi:hypothetical protein
MTDRNDEDTKFVRVKGDDIPTKKYPQTASEVSIVQERKKLFKDMVRGGMETHTSSHFLSHRRVMYTYVYVYVYIYICIYTNIIKRKKQAVTQTCRSQVTVSGQGLQTKHRSG